MAFTLCLIAMCYLVATVESHVIRADKVRIPPQGVTIEILIKPDEGEDLATNFEDIFKKTDYETVNDESITAEDLEKRIKDIFAMTEDGKWKVDEKQEMDFAEDTATTTDLPSIEDRLGIVAGNCPVGYVKRGGFCFPDYD